MNLVRLVTPATGNRTMSCEDRVYSAEIGVANFIPDFDAPALIANGWLPCQADENTLAGPSGERPEAPYLGQLFTDTTVGTSMVFDGQRWRDAATHADC